MRSAVTALIVLLSVCAWAQSASIEPPPHVARGSVEGPGFTITLPADVEMDISPTATIALGINLEQSVRSSTWDGLPQRYIAFNTIWNSDPGSLDAVVRNMTSDLTTLVPAEIAGLGEIRLASTFPAKLGDLPARRLVVEFTNDRKKPSLRQIVVAYRERPGANAVIYVASLTTTRMDFRHDVDLFAKLLAGFKLAAMD